MNRFLDFLQRKIIELILIKNRILGKFNLLPSSDKPYCELGNIASKLTSPNISIRLYEKDCNKKDYIFSVLELLKKYGVSFTLIEFDKIFSVPDLERIEQISDTSKIDFRYVYPNFSGGYNIGTEMSIISYLNLLPKIRHLIKVARYNFSREAEQVLFIAVQLSDYVSFDFDYKSRTMEEFVNLSSLESCLNFRKTVCAGVALAFNRCMTEMGVDNMLNLGYIGNAARESLREESNNHVWNKVKVNGVWYNMDITQFLNNSDFTDLSKEERIKRYALCSDSTLNRNGISIIDGKKIPPANEDFPNVLELYKKVHVTYIVLEQYDLGNRNPFLHLGRDASDVNRGKSPTKGIQGPIKNEWENQPYL